MTSREVQEQKKKPNRRPDSRSSIESSNENVNRHTSDYAGGTSTQNWVPVVMLILYVITSMIGLLPIPWTMTAELFPIEIRGIGHSIALSMANVIMFFAIQCYYGMSYAFGGTAGVQWFFGVVSILASIYVFIVLPETHNKKLSEITDYFKEHSIYLLAAKKVGSPQKTRKRGENRSDIVRRDDQSEKLMSNA